MGRRQRPTLLLPFLIGMIAGWFLRGFNTPPQSSGLYEKTAAKLAAAEAKVSQLLARITETEQLREQLAASEAEMQKLQAQLTTKVVAKDDLTKINGIGKVFANRLHQAGVTTFAQLAALSVEELTEITQAKELQNPADWLAQAKTFSL